MKREGLAKAILDGSAPSCVATSLHAHRNLEPQDAQEDFYLSSSCHNPGSARVTVVVVENNHKLLKAMGDLLGSAGFDARMFSTGEEFLANPGVRNTRCLILDIGMPGMNGIELLRRISALGMDLPCIFLAGRDETDTVLFCRTGGARFLLPKPIAGPELLAAVSLVTNHLRSSVQMGFVDALRSAVSRAGTFSGRPLVSRACSALFGNAKTPRTVRSRADSNLHTVA